MFRTNLILPLLLAVSVTCASTSFAQQSTTTSTVTAQSLTSAAFANLVGSTAVSDVTLAGTAVRFAAGQEQDGTFTFQSKGIASSRVETDFGSSKYGEVRADANGLPAGAWYGNDGVLHPIQQYNCWTEASWFFPALGVLAMSSDTTVQVEYVGAEARNGVAVQHLQFWRAFSGTTNKIAEAMRAQSTIDLYLDSTTLLPVAATFSRFPDNGANQTLRTEIRFANYQSVDGVMVPGRIQKLVNGNLSLDLTIQNVTVNSGLPDSLFALQ